MKLNCLNKKLITYYIAGIFLLHLLVGQEKTFAQCPADPTLVTPNTFNSTMPDNAYFCEGVSSVILEPGISNPSVNFKWYKWNGTTWDGLPQIGSNLARIVGQEGKYAVCWQLLNTGVFKSDEIVLSTKNFSDQLNTENEFVLASSPLFACSNQPVSAFNNTGNPLYDYSWAPATGLSSASIKNPIITLSTVKGRGGAADFAYTLSVIDKKNKCKVSKSIPTKTYPILGPEFKLIPAPLCQNKPSDIEVRVFMVPGYNILSSTLTIGADPVKNFPGTTFLKETANTLTPNKLGQNNTELNKVTDIIHVLRVPVSYSQSGTAIPVKFTMVTDKGCIGAANTTIDVNPSPTYTVELDPLNPAKSNFCINDARMGPLKSSPVAAGTFSGPGVSGDATNGYFFTPLDAKAGNHSIVFTVTAAAGVCAGGGSLPVTVKPAPTPKITGRTNVCPGSFDIEYKDTAKVAAGVTKTWRIVNTNGTNAAGITFAPFTSPPPASTALPDSIRVAFPTSYTEPSNIALVIAENNDAGCTASATIQVMVDENVKSPEPIGDILGCAGFQKIKYIPGSAANLGFKYNWTITKGTKNFSPNTDSTSLEVDWDKIVVLPDTRTIAVTDVSPKQGGGQCFIKSKVLTVNFTNPPIATIKNLAGQSVCAGDTVLVEEKNPITTGITYTWTPGNITGPSTKLIVPNPSASFYSYSLKAELTGSTTCPPSVDTETFTVKATPGDPLPQDLLENCFDDVPLFLITAVFSNVSAPPLPGPFANWLNPLDVNNPAVNDNTWKTSTAGIYSVKAIDGVTGCYKTGSVEIIDVCPAKFFVPAAFSPNGDFANDSLVIFGKRFITFDFKIFNRWGEVVFSTKDPTEKWDGNYGGMPVPVGVYPYSAVFETLNENRKKVSIPKEGSITLIR